MTRLISDFLGRIVAEHKIPPPEPESGSPQSAEAGSADEIPLPADSSER